MARTVIVASLNPIAPLSERGFGSLRVCNQQFSAGFVAGACGKTRLSSSLTGLVALPRRLAMMNEITLRRKRCSVAH
jgi:hypothetical protein